MDNMITLASQDDVNTLVSALNESQQCASRALGDDDVSMAFQDALLKDWGDDVQIPNEDSETLSRLSLQHGSAIFFLAQESGAVKSIMHLLSNLYFNGTKSLNVWDRSGYAEPLLIENMVSVVDKFLISEKNDGHLVDYTVWQKVGENSGKVALYCTSFATVVIDILKIIVLVQHENFDKYKAKFFPRLCALICTESSDIRKIVHEIFAKHIGPYLG
jgi:hypothetical protein